MVQCVSLWSTVLVLLIFSGQSSCKAWIVPQLTLRQLQSQSRLLLPSIYYPCKLLQTKLWSSANSDENFINDSKVTKTDDVIGSDDIISFDDDNDDNARSQFGTRQYWDDMYLGRGDFDSEEYSWYFGWEILQTYVQEYIPKNNNNNDNDCNPSHILCPGIGNDPLLVDLYKAGYTHVTAFDYSEFAIERQQDLLSYELPAKALDTLELCPMDARQLPQSWHQRFDAILEKGALDAIYLSGDGNVERAVQQLYEVLKPGGVFLHFSGVVPEDLRRDLFADWEWIRDGSDELKAGAFVFRKPL